MDKEIIDPIPEIDFSDKTDACSLIHHNIEQIYKYADQWTYVPLTTYKISPEEINQYIMSCRYSGDLPIREIQVKSADVSDEETLIQLYDYTEVYPEDELYLKGQKIYFIEGSIAALTIIPIQLTHNEMHIHMELLDRSPDFIQNIWRGKYNKYKIEDIPFLKPNQWKTKKKRKN